METKLFSPLLSSANNIVKMKRSLPKRARDYDDFITWLDTSNKDIKKIKLPKKKKVEDLQFSVGSSLDGGGGGNLIGNLLGGLGALGAGLGLRTLFKGKKVNKLPKEKIGKIKGIPNERLNNIKEAPKGRFGRIAGPLNVAFAGLDFMGRKGEGQSNLQAGVGAAGGALGGWAGAEAGAAAGAAIGALFGGVGAVPGAIIGGLIGGIGGGQLGGNIADKFTGADKIDERLKAQETKQREAVSSDITFPDIVNKFDKIISKFEKFATGMGAAISGKQPSKAGNGEYEPSDQPLAPNDPTEPPPPPLPPGSFAKAPDEVLSDAASFRQAFPLAKATPKLSIEPYELQMRENDSLGSLGNDPQVDPVHAKGSAHYENRAIDIPVNNMDLGDKVANWWRGKGYKVLWRVEGHYNHVHVQWAKGQKKDKPNSSQNNKVNTITKQQSIEDFIKGTKSGDRILNDPKLKAQLTGEKYQFKNTMVKTPVSDPEVKQAQQMYNAYVRDIRSRQQDQVKAQTGDQIPSQIMTPPSTAAQQSAIFLMGDQSQQVASQPQVVPIPIGNGGGGGGVAVITPSEGQILNSLWTTMLLTNLSSA